MPIPAGIRRLQLRRAAYISHYGPSDPRTVAVTRALAEAMAAAAEAEAARLRALADAMAESAA